MILPYVYMLTHKTTGRFYYGYRYKNVKLGKSSTEDLGTTYFTSSSRINKDNFLEFNVVIVAEFFNKQDAYWHEQQLIKDSKKNVLLLNKHYQDPETSHTEFVNYGHSAETKKKMTGKLRTAEFREYRKNVMTGTTPWNKGLTKETDARMQALAENRKIVGNLHQIGMTYSAERIKKIQEKLLGRVVPDDQRKKMSLAKKSKKWEEIYTPEEILRRRCKLKERTGIKHPRSKPIHTPTGRFNSLAEVVLQYNVAEATVRARCLSTKEKWNEWYYATLT